MKKLTDRKKTESRQKIIRALLTMVLILAVAAYTIYNYANGLTDRISFMIYMVILAVPFANMAGFLYQELKGK